MKSRLIFLIAALSCCFLLPAQTHYAGTVSIGAKGGFEMSRVFFKPSVPQKLAFGATAGVMVRYIEENHFGIIAEVNWEQRGWEEQFDELPFSYKRSLNYIQIPVLAHIYFGRRGRFFFNAGPQIGFFISESTKANFDPTDINNIPNFPTQNRMNTQQTLKVQNKIDYGISAGLGGEFFVSERNSLMLEARFYYGLGNIFHAKRIDPFSASNSMSISVSAGYWFRVK